MTDALAQAADNKAFEALEMDEQENTRVDSFGFSLQQRLASSKPSSGSGLQFVITIALLVLVGVSLIISIVTVYGVYNPPAVSCSSDTPVTGEFRGTSTDLYGVMQSIDSKLNETQSAVQWANQNVTLIKSDQGAKLEAIQTMLRDQMEYVVNTSSTLNGLSESTTQKLIDIVGSLATLELNGVQTSAVLDNIYLLVVEVLRGQNSSAVLNPYQYLTCADLLKAEPTTPSGYYHLNSETVYCNMDNLCEQGNGWTRLGYLDMSDATASCPDGFKLHESGGVRACGRPSGTLPGCTGLTLQPSEGQTYSQVCGRVVGYQFGHTHGFGLGGGGVIDEPYVEGVSITYGSDPRTHIWTLGSGLRESHTDNGLYNCPCSTGSQQITQSFVGNNYYCESGNPDLGIYHKLFPDDVLWDGEQCGTLEPDCCTQSSIQPWFYRNFTTLSDYIEIRVCGDQGADYEDVPISLYEIYVK